MPSGSSSGGGGSGPEPDAGSSEDAGAECSFGEVPCGERCSDLVTDPQNCGTCGAACAAGEACVAGLCEAAAACGNGVCEVSETLEACPDDCAPPIADEREPNDSCGTAQVVSSWATRILGTFQSSSDSDWYQITHDGGGDLEVYTNDVTSDSCGRTSERGSDTVLDLYRDDCLTLLAHSDDDATASTYCSRFAIPALPAGTYYVRARTVSLGTDDSYEIELGE
jgi:hypothetical protein